VRAVAAGSQLPWTRTPLRHSFATDLLRGGADIRSVQASSAFFVTTSPNQYTHVTDRGLRRDP